MLDVRVRAGDIDGGAPGVVLVLESVPGVFKA